MPRLRETGGSQEGIEGHSPGEGDRTGGQQCLGHTHWAGQRRLTVRAAFLALALLSHSHGCLLPPAKGKGGGQLTQRTSWQWVQNSYPCRWAKPIGHQPRAGSGGSFQELQKTRARTCLDGNGS